MRGVFVVTAKVSRPRWPNLAAHSLFYGWHGRCQLPPRSDVFLKGKLTMKKLVSFVLGAVVLFGAATFGLQSATANANDKHDKNYWKHHHHHHKHHRHYKNHLSY